MDFKKSFLCVGSSVLQLISNVEIKNDTKPISHHFILQEKLLLIKLEICSLIL